MTRRAPLEAGDLAPSFVLPAADREGTVAIEDYRGQSALLIGFYRGLACPFCRRQIAQLSAAQEKLRAESVECVAVVVASVERARWYCRYHPARVTVAADADAETHLLYGVPRFEVLPDDGPTKAVWPHSVTLERLTSLRLNPGGLLSEPVAPHEAVDILARRDGYQLTPEDLKTWEAHITQLVGLFLIDEQGVVRWRYLEAINDLGDVGLFPSEHELLTAARSLARPIGKNLE